MHYTYLNIAIPETSVPLIGEQSFCPQGSMPWGGAESSPSEGAGVSIHTTTKYDKLIKPFVI